MFSCWRVLAFYLAESMAGPGHSDVLCLRQWHRLTVHPIFEYGKFFFVFTHALTRKNCSSPNNVLNLRPCRRCAFSAMTKSSSLSSKLAHSISSPFLSVLWSQHVYFGFLHSLTCSTVYRQCALSVDCPTSLFGRALNPCYHKTYPILNSILQFFPNYR